MYAGSPFLIKAVTKDDLRKEATYTSLTHRLKDTSLICMSISNIKMFALRHTNQQVVFQTVHYGKYILLPSSAIFSRHRVN
jgi:hypothetical protein